VKKVREERIDEVKGGQVVRAIVLWGSVFPLACSRARMCGEGGLELEGGFCGLGVLGSSPIGTVRTLPYLTEEESLLTPVRSSPTSMITQPLPVLRRKDIVLHLKKAGLDSLRCEELGRTVGFT